MHIPPEEIDAFLARLDEEEIAYVMNKLSSHTPEKEEEEEGFTIDEAPEME